MKQCSPGHILLTIPLKFFSEVTHEASERDCLEIMKGFHVYSTPQKLNSWRSSKNLKTVTLIGMKGLSLSL